MLTASPAVPATAATDRARANKTNAGRSTGPKTAAGKTRSSLNAIKTGLTGRTVLLPSDDEEAYRNHVNAYVEEFAPVGVRESALVQSLADYAWRLDRIVTLEMSIYAIGHATLASTTDEHRTLIQYRTHLAYEKQLRNLHLQESRLRRHREKDLAELNQLQQNRRAAEKAREEAAAKSPDKPAVPSEAGFVFSTGAVQDSIEPRQPSPRLPDTRTNTDSLTAR